MLDRAATIDGLSLSPVAHFDYVCALGMWELYFGDLNNARKAYEQALRDIEEYWGKNLCYYDCLSQVALVAQRQKRFDEAKAAYEEILRVRSGHEHINITRNNYAVLLLDSGASKATQDKYRGVCDNAGVQMALLPRGLLQDATGRSGVAMAVAPGGLAEQIRQNLPVEGKEEHGQQMKSENHGGGASVE